MKYIVYILLLFIGLNIFGVLFAIGGSYPHQFPKQISVTMPTTTP